MARVLEPHLISSYVYHADATDPLTDAPTVRLLRQLQDLLRVGRDAHGRRRGVEQAEVARVRGVDLGVGEPGDREDPREAHPLPPSHSGIVQHRLCRRGMAG